MRDAYILAPIRNPHGRATTQQETMALTPIEIKTELMKRGVSMTELAKRWGTTREIVSRVIHRYGGYAYPDIRRRLARYLAVPVSEVGREDTRRKRRAA